ncbi:MAG: tryptophan--tRNA ligase [Bacteroidota bacterium]
METVVSGIRSTGKMHLGNYFGAVKNFVKMQREHNCYFFVADYHSLTTHPVPQDLHNNVKQVLVEFLAAGIDPDIATLYIQSNLPETAELYLLLNMNAYKGELERCTSYKEKVKEQKENVNAGLLTYPVLMAADILIHKAIKVPVGKDQKQHLEMTRTFARRFNHMYKTDYFPVPYAFNFGESLIKIPGLDGSGKMGKSEGEENAVYLSDPPDVIRNKVMHAVTDSGPAKENQKKPEPILNLFTIMEAVSAPNTVAHFNELYNKCKIRYVDLKKQLAEDIITFTDPLREKILKLSSDKEYLKKVIKNGTEKARESASKTIKDAREIIGFRGF